MKKYIILCLLVLGMGWITVYAFNHGYKSDIRPRLPKSTPVPLNATKIFNLLNDYRKSHSVAPLTWDGSMCTFANTRLKEIHTNYSHKGFYNEEQSFYGNGYTVGENISMGFIDEQDTTNGWIHSPDHLANIIYAGYTRTCIAVDRYNNDTYAVQEFAN